MRHGDTASHTTTFDGGKSAKKKNAFDGDRSHVLLTLAAKVIPSDHRGVEDVGIGCGLC